MTDRKLTEASHNHYVEASRDPAAVTCDGPLFFGGKIIDAFVAGAEWQRSQRDTVEELSRAIVLTTADGAYRFTATGPHDARAEKLKDVDANEEIERLRAALRITRSALDALWGLSFPE